MRVRQSRHSLQPFLRDEHHEELYGEKKTYIVFVKIFAEKGAEVYCVGRDENTAFSYILPGQSVVHYALPT